jgi:hypothetical protein
LARKRAGLVTPPDPGEDEFASFDEVLSRIIGELTEMRVRQRALLQVLDAGEFSWSQYVDTVRNVRKRDFDALFSAIVNRQEVFVERFKDWMDQDMKSYLYHTGLLPDESDTKPPIERKSSRRAPARRKARKRS